MRVDQERDLTKPLRWDMMADIYDALDIINPDVPYTGRDAKMNAITVSFNYAANKFYWKTDPFSEGGKELPCNIIYDKESEVDDNQSRNVNKLDLTIEHITADGKETGQTLKLGMQDALNVIRLIEGRLLKKYNINYMVMKSNDMGVEQLEKKYGSMQAVIEIEYVSADRWQL